MNSDESLKASDAVPPFGGSEMTRAFALLRRFPPLDGVFRYPGRWSELLARAGRAATVDELSETDRAMLLAAERAAIASTEGVLDAPKPTPARRKGGRRVWIDRQE